MSERSCVIAVLFLAVLVFGVIIGSIIGVKSSGASIAQYPLVHVSPEGIGGLNPSETFTVTVAVSGLAGGNLYGFDINFTWDNAVLQYISHEAKVPVETYPEGVLHQSVIEIMNEVDMSAGTLWLAYASMLPSEPFNEDGVFFTITFVVLQSSSENPYRLEHAILVNNNGEIIPINGCQNPETLTLPSGSHELNAYRVLRNEKWLEWWIHIAKSGARRRLSGGAP